MGYLDKALETIRQQQERIVNHDLLDATFREIGRKYRPGLIRWIRVSRPREWKKMTLLEERINAAALNQDEIKLKQVLTDYQTFFLRIGEDFTSPQGDLFEKS